MGMESIDDQHKETLSVTKPVKNENPFTEAAPQLPPHLMGVYFLNVENINFVMDNNNE